MILKTIKRVSLIGASIATVQITSGDILLHHFDSEKVKSALAFMMIGAALGRTIHPILVQYLYEQFSFMIAMVIIGSFMLVHTLGGISYTKDQPHKGIENKTDQDDAQTDDSQTNTVLKSLKEDMRIILPNCRVSLIDCDLYLGRKNTVPQCLKEI